MTTTTTYAVTRYQDGQVIGHVDLTSEQFARYESMAQRPQGIIRLGDLPCDLYDLDPEYQDAHEDTVVWLD